MCIKKRVFSWIQFFLLFCIAGVTFSGKDIFADDGFPLVLVDKAKHHVHLARYQDHRIQIQNTYHATLGKALGDKEVENDLKTPEGIYFFTSKLAPPQIKKKFGQLALLTNYPNPIDKHVGKTGYDIMLHATDDPSRLKLDYDSEGCIVIDNPEIKHISKSVVLGLTPFIIYSEMKEEYLAAEAKPHIKEAFQKWIQAWQSKDLDTYIGSYVDHFRYNGMNLKAYRAYKAALNKRYSEINIRAEKVKYLYHPKYDVVMFNQHYDSKLRNGAKGFHSVGTKMVYFVKVGDEYKIANEHYTPVKDL